MISAFSGRDKISKLVGNTSGLKTAQLKRLARLGKKRIAPDLIVSHEMARSMTEISHDTGRQVGILIDRSGQVNMVIVGDAKQIVIPALSGIRSSSGRLKGLRCIHTHLAAENLTDDDLVDLLFLRLDLMSIIKIRPDGQPEKLYSAHLVPSPRAGKNWAFLEPMAGVFGGPVFVQQRVRGVDQCRADLSGELVINAPMLLVHQGYSPHLFHVL